MICVVHCSRHHFTKECFVLVAEPGEGVIEFQRKSSTGKGWSNTRGEFKIRKVFVLTVLKCCYSSKLLLVAA